MQVSMMKWQKLLMIVGSVRCDRAVPPAFLSPPQAVDTRLPQQLVTTTA
jgi:hypothetical protein